MKRCCYSLSQIVSSSASKKGIKIDNGELELLGVRGVFEVLAESVQRPASLIKLIEHPVEYFDTNTNVNTQ